MKLPLCNASGWPSISRNTFILKPLFSTFSIYTVSAMDKLNLTSFFSSLCELYYYYYLNTIAFVTLKLILPYSDIPYQFALQSSTLDFHGTLNSIGFPSFLVLDFCLHLKINI